MSSEPAQVLADWLLAQGDTYPAYLLKTGQGEGYLDGLALAYIRHPDSRALCRLVDPHLCDFLAGYSRHVVMHCDLEDLMLPRELRWWVYMHPQSSALLVSSNYNFWTVMVESALGGAGWKRKQGDVYTWEKEGSQIHCLHWMMHPRALLGRAYDAAFIIGEDTPPETWSNAIFRRVLGPLPIPPEK